VALTEIIIFLISRATYTNIDTQCMCARVRACVCVCVCVFINYTWETRKEIRGARLEMRSSYIARLGARDPCKATLWPHYNKPRWEEATWLTLQMVRGTLDCLYIPLFVYFSLTNANMLNRHVEFIEFLLLNSIFLNQ